MGRGYPRPRKHSRRQGNASVKWQNQCDGRSFSGRLLPGEMRLRRMAPPSSAKRIKPKDAVMVAAVAKKSKQSDKPVSSGEKRAVQEEQLPPTTELDAEPVDRIVI